MKQIKYISILILVLTTSTGCIEDNDEFNFKVTAQKTELGIDEIVQVHFTINKNIENFITPFFGDFTALGEPSTGVSRRWENGIRSYSKTYTYNLKPTKIGNLIIEEATINYKNKEYKTNSLTIKVTK